MTQNAVAHAAHDHAGKIAQPSRTHDDQVTIFSLGCQNYGSTRSSPADQALAFDATFLAILAAGGEDAFSFFLRQRDDVVPGVPAQ